MRAAKSPLELSLIPSKILFLARLGLVVIASINLILLPIFVWAKLLAFAVVAIQALTWVRQWHRSEPKILRFYPAKGHWRVDNSVELRPEADQFVTRSLVIVYLAGGDGRRCCRVIPRDALSNQQHRQLRQLLHFPVLALIAMDNNILPRKIDRYHNCISSNRG